MTETFRNSLFVLLFSGLALPGFAQQLNPGAMDGRLFLEIQQSAPDTYHEVFVVLKDRFDTDAYQEQTLRASFSQKQKTQGLLHELHTKAAATQPALLDFIQRSGKADPSATEAYWITNAIYIRAKKELIAALSRRPDVLWIEKNEILEHDEAPAPESPAPPVPNGREPGLDAINAPALWALGYTGYGRKLLVIDSGQDPEHPALRNQFAYNYAPLGQTYLSSALPDYCDPHGTGVTSAAVGMDPITRDTIGVAFNAQWLGAPFSNLRNVETNEFCVYRGSVRDVVGALQWALNPDGNTGTVDDIPDVVNNSYGRSLSNVAECSQVWPDLFRNLDAAGVAVVFSAGNNGPDPSSVSLQPSISINDVTPFSVGAVFTSSLGIADFSSRGPSQCTNFLNPDLDIKPEVVAPGVNVRVASTGRVQYGNISGTSFSAPYVSGALLLLKEAFPTLPGRELARALYNSATDLGLPGEDNTYGKGLINVFAAYQSLINRGFQPVAPAAARVDAVHLNSTPRLLNCGGRIFIETAFRNGGTEVLRSLDIIVRREFSTTPLFTMKWEGALAPGATANIVLPEFASTFGTYTIEVELRNPNGVADDRPLNNQLKRRVSVSPQPLLPQVSVSAPTTCSNGRALLSSSYDGDGVLRWYNRPEGGTALAEGLQFYTGPLTQDTAFYAELRFNRNIGKADTTGGGKELSTAATGGLKFTALAPFTLKTVLVFAEVAGPRNIRLKRPDGSIQQRLVNVPRAGANRLTLGFSIEPGEGYVLDISLGRELYTNTTGTNFPYQIPGVLRIDGSENTNTAVYPFFYDWEVEYNYPCGRMPVRIDVESGSESVKAAFTGPSTAVPLSNGTASVSFQNTSTAATRFSWNFGDGNTSTEAHPTHTYSKAGTYQVSLIASNGGSCNDIAIGAVTISAVTALSDPGLDERRFRVYPNPAQEMAVMELSLEQPEEVRAELTDLLGRQLRNWELGKVRELRQQVDLSALQPGTYVLTLYGNSFRQGRKILVIR